MGLDLLKQLVKPITGASSKYNNISIVMNDSLNKSTSNYGVYFSANDAVYDWAIAFLNSFRTYNPALPLILIPFDDSCEKLFRLSNKYNFDVFEDSSFQQLELIGENLEMGHTSYGPRWFRRYAAFWGPFDEFLYLDVRQVVLSDLEDFLQAPAKYGFDLVHYDIALDQVYEPGPMRTKFLRNGKGRGFMSGIWASRSNMFTLEEFRTYGFEIVPNRESFNLRNTDQAFINYCCDSMQVQYGHIAEILGGTCHSSWAGQSGHVYRDEQGDYRLWDHGGLDHKKRLILYHWAGIPLGAGMKGRWLFRYYRYLRSTSWERMLINIKDIIILPFAKSISVIRRNRLINQIYHQIFS